MSKVRYRYNPKTLSYEKEKVTTRARLWQLTQILGAGVVVGILLVFAFRSALNSAENRKLIRENAHLKLQYDLVSKKMDQMSVVLKDLQERDDNIYRVIFEAEPIPPNLRQGGTGGVPKYQALKGYASSDMVINTHVQLDRLSKQLYIQSKSFDAVYDMAKEKEKMLAHLPSIQPVSNKDLKRIASGFGKRIDPHYKTPSMHYGIDFTAKTGTEIYATADGGINKANRISGFGNHVRIDHGYGYLTLYAHLSKIAVKKGQRVKRGDVIGYVGNTGKSTGPHLHYEVHKNGHPINPVNFFFNDLTPAEYDKVLQLSTAPNQSFD
ncbi:MAG: M23 family metallopeptidase [Salibacteraceae bacterium]